MPNIRGLQPISLIDYPGEVAVVVFLGGCNFRCGFCHNPELVLSPATHPKIEEEELFAFLDKRKEKLDGVVVTGGEPCMNKDLPEFIKKIKQKGFLVKLDTNGSYPEILTLCLPSVDYIAMDIKSDLQKYSIITNSKVNINKIKISIDRIRQSGKRYEFRTTIHPKQFTKENLENIGQWLKGSEKYVLQNFVYQDNLVDNTMPAQQFTKEQMKKFKEKAEKYFERVIVR